MNVSQIVIKVFATQRFFTNNMKRKTVKSSHQILGNCKYFMWRTFQPL